MPTSLSSFATAVQTLVDGSSGYTAYTYETLAHGSTDVQLATLTSGAPYTIYTDCSGWVNYALSSVAPLHQAVLAAERLDAIFNPGNVTAYNGAQVTINEAAQPWARADVLSYFFNANNGLAVGGSGFTSVTDFSTLQAGDIIAYATGIYTDPSNAYAPTDPTLGATSDTGHTMIVTSAPVAVPLADWGYYGSTNPTPGVANAGLDPTTTAVYAVSVVDSSNIAHFANIPGFTEPQADTRSYGAVQANPPNLPNTVPQNQLQVGGLGAGTIWFAVNSSGAIQFRFDVGDPWFPNTSGASGAANAVSISVGRMTNSINLSGSMLQNNRLVVNTLPNAAPVLQGTTYDTQSETLTGGGGLWVQGGGSLKLGGGNSFTGGIVLNGATVELSAAASAGTGITTFNTGAVSTLKIDVQAALPGTAITNIAYQDQIDLGYLTWHSGTTAVLSGNTLTVTSNGVSTQVQLSSLASGVTGFTTGNDGSNGTLVTVACFAAGTLIETDAGPRLVEDLRAGDQVMAHFAGGAVPLRWIGHRHFDLQAPATPANVHPIRVRAGSFGAGLPYRDLVLSPEHAVFVNGVLIPIRHLVDGHDIATFDAAEIQYFHLLLDRHDIVSANGLACESLLEVDDPASFANAAEAPDSLVFLHPCAPRITQGEALEHVRRRLTARV